MNSTLPQGSGNFHVIFGVVGEVSVGNTEVLMLKSHRVSGLSLFRNNESKFERTSSRSFFQQQREAFRRVSKIFLRVPSLSFSMLRLSYRKRNNGRNLY